MSSYAHRSHEHFHSKHFLLVFTFDGTEFFFFGIFIAWIYKFNGKWWWMLHVSHTHRAGHYKHKSKYIATLFNKYKFNGRKNGKRLLIIFFSSSFKNCRDIGWLCDVRVNGVCAWRGTHCKLIFVHNETGSAAHSFGHRHWKIISVEWTRALGGLEHPNDFTK